MDSGSTRISSRHSVAETMQRLESFLKERGVMIFYADLRQSQGRHPAHTGGAGRGPGPAAQGRGLDAAFVANLAGVVPLIERAARD